jgi:hypothetical protein
MRGRRPRPSIRTVAVVIAFSIGIADQWIDPDGECELRS